mgnify:CR=1 FL=1
MKCAECNREIQETFLKKIIGTYIKKNGKRVAICSDCQKKTVEKKK